MNASKLEPVERNFKREVTTLIAILVLAFITGGVIILNYTKTRTEQNKEMFEGRAPEIGELVKNYSFKNKEDKNASFFECTGQVTLLACVSSKQLKDSETVISVLKHLAKTFEGEERVRIMLLSMDNEEDYPAGKVVPVLTEAGLMGGQWDVAMSNGEPFLAYIKNQMKFIHLAKRKNSKGEWIIPQRIRLMGPNLKLKGKENEYDFAKILTDQKQAKEELKDDPAFRDDPKFQGDFLVDHAKAVMEKNIRWMLANEEFDKTVIDEGKKANIYKVPLFIFAGFILFLVILGLKVKRQQTK